MTSDLRSALRGISGILVTPYDKTGEIDPVRQKAIVDKAIAVGVHILVANGNTGEFYALTIDEAETMARASAEYVGGRVPLLAGVGRGVRDACRLARTSREAGAAALMIHQPPDPFSAPRGLVDYVRAVADAAEGLPIVLYLRNDAIGIKAIRELCELPSVIGVKWATPNPLKLAEAIGATDPGIVWVGGLAEVWAPAFYAVGARGFTSGLINVWPQRSVAIHTALEAGDYRAANRLIAGMKAFEDIRAEELNGTNVTGVKAALAAIGHDCGATRAPSAWPLTDTQQATLHAFINSNEIRF
ncbi:dihydrodipicolinate synthase family protein [Phyllobacterium brassicacearum]|uniref:Dihydrodipicolinate synthase family protein n=1 Tax=Phyllobacterium brassicacearum TaxID=314235 RepID=A0A2P7BAE9_9HYPH|nr:dihydrodipicolinate synthase family protein [Phyllobacterium brassicacearum]PSH63440.1 dihydrodipicolinate synthase family protein [Phyllobacterium brassicacearum]TDQ18049.1 4-hydroxy-tetrahydrodipicolinate synthase [Phyllobacterium brassicacearum]